MIQGGGDRQSQKSKDKGGTQGEAGCSPEMGKHRKRASHTRKMHRARERRDSMGGGAQNQGRQGETTGARRGEREAKWRARSG